MHKIGFLVNPVAGSGGKIGHKGSDDLAINNPDTPQKVARFLKLAPKDNIKYITPKGIMGEIYFDNSFNVKLIDVKNIERTTREDTIIASKTFLELNCDIIVFAGGDGTARDIYSVVGNKIPLLGIPTGVKMHSGVFANTPEAAAILLLKYINNEASIIDAEILDIDEDEYRKGRYNVKLYGIAKTVSYLNYLTPSKEEIKSNEEELDAIADYFIDTILKDNEYYVFGSGSTVKYILKKLGYETNFLSIDVTYGRKLLISSANYYDLLNLTGELNLVLTPIGKQGFLLGRGNQEIGPEVIRKIKKDKIIIISTKSKLKTIDCLRIDTGDSELDKKLQGVYKVIVGYGEYVAIKTCDNTSVVDNDNT
ncbi:ATP-NAD kinase family protein [Sulfurisphaera javensis]|uniref:ATP-NAD kinase family protein n=1 Tax=Sulfurisphaera javensis TaxID=2049879 RepID=A0AAT9GTZ9_9CREN